MSKTIQNNFVFNWVLINEIAIGTGPKAQEDVFKLERKGIKSILSLCSEEESKPPNNIDNFFKCERIILPDHTYNRIITFEELKSALDILEKLKKYRPTFVHCKASVERSPLICIAWLVEHKDLTIQQSLDYLMRVNKGSCPSADQLKILKKLY